MKMYNADQLHSLRERIGRLDDADLQLFCILAMELNCTPSQITLSPEKIEALAGIAYRATQSRFHCFDDGDFPTLQDADTKRRGASASLFLCPYETGVGLVIVHGVVQTPDTLP